MILSVADSRPRNMQSIQVQDLLPEHISNDSNIDSLSRFLEDYYEYMNSEGQPSREIASISQNKDIDAATEKYLDEIEFLIAKYTPKSNLIDRERLLKIINHYYTVRGTEEGTKLFFKLFYGEDISINYPRERIFATSDGSGKYVNFSRQIVTLPDGTVLNVKKYLDIVDNLDRRVYGQYEYNTSLNLYENIGKVVDNEYNLLQFGNTIIGSGLYSYSGHNVAMSSDGATVAVSDRKGTVKTYRYNSSSESWTQFGNTLTGQSEAIKTITFTDLSDTIALTASGGIIPPHGLNNGDEVSFTGIINTKGVEAERIYYVTNKTTTTFKITDTPGGKALPFTTNGTGNLVVYRRFGHAMAFDQTGTLLLISEPGYSNGSHSGRVILYKYDNTAMQWVPAKMGDSPSKSSLDVAFYGTVSNGDDIAVFGHAIAFNALGNSIAISSTGHTGGVNLDYVLTQKYKEDPPIYRSVVLNASTDTITLSSHGFKVGDVVSFSNIGDAVGPQIDKKYYVVNVSTNTFKIANRLDSGQIETATAVGTITVPGNALVVLTSKAITNGSKTLNVAVSSGDTANDWAEKIRTALTADSEISLKFEIRGELDKITLVRRPDAFGLYAANDPSLNISLANGTCSGIVAAPKSTDGKDGVPIEFTAGGTAQLRSHYSSWQSHGIFPLDESSLREVIFSQSNDHIVLQNHGFVNGDIVIFNNVRTTDEIVARREYYVVNKTTNNFQVALTSGGSPIAFTKNGSGNLLPQATGIGKNLNVLNGENFGWALSYNTTGTRLAIGIPGASKGKIGKCGKIDVYDFISSNEKWSLLGNSSLYATNSPGERYGTSLSLSGDGNTLVGGAPYRRGTRSTSQINVGCVVSYSWKGQYWKTLGKTPLYGKYVESLYGFKVECNSDGTRLVISAPGREIKFGDANINTYSYIHSYEFDLQLDQWNERWSTLENKTYDQYLGYSLACDKMCQQFVCGTPYAYDSSKARRDGIVYLESSTQENGKPTYVNGTQKIAYTGTRWAWTSNGVTQNAELGDEDYPWLASWPAIPVTRLDQQARRDGINYSQSTQENGKPTYVNGTQKIAYTGTRWAWTSNGVTQNANIGNEDYPWLASWPAIPVITFAPVGTTNIFNLNKTNNSFASDRTTRISRFVEEINGVKQNNWIIYDIFTEALTDGYRYSYITEPSGGANFDYSYSSLEYVDIEPSGDYKESTTEPFITIYYKAAPKILNGSYTILSDDNIEIVCPGHGYTAGSLININFSNDKALRDNIVYSQSTQENGKPTYVNGTQKIAYTGTRWTWTSGEVTENAELGDEDYPWLASWPTIPVTQTDDLLGAIFTIDRVYTTIKENDTIAIKNTTSNFKRVSFNPDTNTVNFTNHSLLDGTPVSFSSITTTTGISSGVDYYTLIIDSDTFQLSEIPGGQPIDLLGYGSADMTFKRTFGSGDVSIYATPPVHPYEVESWTPVTTPEFNYTDSIVVYASPDDIRWVKDNNKGTLSDYYKIQDSDYYQIHSYEIKTQLPPQYWIDEFKGFCHPSGYELFSLLEIVNFSKNNWVDFIEYKYGNRDYIPPRIRDIIGKKERNIKLPTELRELLSTFGGQHTPRSQPGRGIDRLLLINIFVKMLDDLGKTYTGEKLIEKWNASDDLEISRVSYVRNMVRRLNSYLSFHFRTKYERGINWEDVKFMGDDLDGQDDVLYHNVGKTVVYSYNSTSKKWTQLGDSPLGQRGDIDAGSVGDSFGYSVSLNAAGTRIAVGAPWNDNDNDGNYLDDNDTDNDYRNDTSNLSGLLTNIGATYIYDYNTTTQKWTQVGNPIIGETAGDLSGWNIMLNDSGSRVVIGAPNAGSTDHGHVRAYEYISGTWTKLGTDIDGVATNDRTGTSVAINSSGSRIAIGTPYNNGEVGNVKVYEYVSNSWSQIGVTIVGPTSSDRFGWSLSLDGTGNKLIIGAPQAGDDSGGRAYVYAYNGSQWIQEGGEIVPDILFTTDSGATPENFGWSVAINNTGTRVAVGSPQSDFLSRDNRGYTMIYELSNGSWTLLGQTIEGELSGSNGGLSLALNSSGSRVVIGSPNAGGGHTKVYEYNASTQRWEQLGNDLYGDAFPYKNGWSVDINSTGDRIVVGESGSNSRTEISDGQSLGNGLLDLNPESYMILSTAPASSKILNIPTHITKYKTTKKIVI